MSYDLMVFDPEVAPFDRAAFMRWYDDLTKWSEGHSYYDPSVTTPALRAWYDAMRVDWFPMNGPDSPLTSDIPVESELWDDPRATGYTICKSAIYCDFRWSMANEAHQAVNRFAFEHEVGFFDVSADNGAIIFPAKYV